MSSRIHLAFASALPLSLLAACPAHAQRLDGHIAPAVARFGQNLGQESPSAPLRLTMYLNLHNRADLDGKVAAMYTKGSPCWHQWLTTADLKAYAPTSAELAAVRQELAAHHITVLSADPLNLSVVTTGKTSDFEAALHTTIQRTSVQRPGQRTGQRTPGQAELVRTSSSVPALSGAAAGLISHVGGLNSLSLKPMLTFPIDPRTHEHLGTRLASAPAGAVFASQCFYTPAAFTVTGVAAADGTTGETANYTGLVYGASLANTAPGTVGPCGYGAADLSTVYGLGKIYGEGYSGAGQTIVVLDPYLEPTIQADLDTYNKVEGLPAVTINKVNPLGATLSGITQGWNIEADLDVELSHAIAPGAGITLLEAFSSDNEDLQSAMLYAVENHLGNVISNSYGAPESYTSPLASTIWNQIIELAAAEGISVHFATGDSGDYTADGIPADVSSPADSPYATAVGGTSVGLMPGGQVITTGWGNNTSLLTEGGLGAGIPPLIFDPTQTSAFYAGSGGGISAFFAKPTYQAALLGSGRHLPDVSAIADPYTGAEFVYTDGTAQYVGVVGGTSLATPVFSGMWAILDEAVNGSLGQAAPLVALGANTPFLQDVVPAAGPANATGSVASAAGTTTYSATTLAQPLELTTQFTSAIFNLGSDTLEVVTFGTDSGLTVTQGWDNVTGYGTPNLGNIADLIAQLQ